MYRWHLQWADLHVYLQAARIPSVENGNVFATVGSALLWQRGGIQGAVAEIQRRIEELGGRVQSFKISRCDLAADIQLTEPLSEHYVQRCSVPSNLKNNAHRSGDRLETIYLGAKDSPIRLRIYDKSLELSVSCEKLWVLDIWNVSEPADVWRFEFQLRRDFLKSLGINSFDDLQRLLSGAWKYLTEDWFTLRTPTSSNATRRPIEPLWLAVQSAGAALGTPVSVSRRRSQGRASQEWYGNRISGLIAGLAAVSGQETLDEALTVAARLVRSYWNQKDFAEDVQIRRLKNGGGK